MRKRGGLGRGLGALIPSAPEPTAGPAADAAGIEQASSGAMGTGGQLDPGKNDGGDPATQREASTKQDPEAAALRSPAASGAVSAANKKDVGGGEAARRGAANSGAASADGDGEAALGEVPGARYAELPVDQIRPNPRQPREQFEEEAMAELRTSVREIGVLQPVVVRQTGRDSYELIMGERRWRASIAEQLATIPTIIREVGDDALLRDALLENIHRSDLNPLEEAAAYQQLLQEFGATQEELASRIGRSRPQISNTLRLLQLPPAVQRRVAARVLSAGHARALLGLAETTAQTELATRIVAEGLSVRATEELVSIAASEQPSKTAAARKRPALKSPGIEELAEQLSDRFDTRVKVQLGRRKGRVVIEFATVEDLERIAGVMGVPGRRPPSGTA